MEFELRRNEPLSKHTTLQIGGVADALAVVKSEAELRAALRYAGRHTATPPLILGGGSNVLCRDEGYSGLVIVNRITGYEVVNETSTEVHLRVGAGEVFDEVVAKTITDGYWGLENLSAIPGSVGATPIQNVGAYGVEIASLIHTVEAVHRETQERRVFTPAECTFAYRDSYFKSAAGKDWVITYVTYRLSKTAQPILTYKDFEPLRESADLSQSAIREHVMAVRAKKFPNWHEVGTAGSFFKNPVIDIEHFNTLQTTYPELPGFPVDKKHVKVSLGWILDKVCDLRGYRAGSVRLFEAQALVLVAEAGATATAVEEFVAHVAKQVKAQTDITIEREVLTV